MINRTIAEEWLSESVTQAALTHLEDRIKVAKLNLNAMAEKSSDPAVQAAWKLVFELEQFRTTLKEGRF